MLAADFGHIDMIHAFFQFSSCRGGGDSGLCASGGGGGSEGVSGLGGGGSGLGRGGSCGGQGTEAVGVPRKRDISAALRCVCVRVCVCACAYAYACACT